MMKIKIKNMAKAEAWCIRYVSPRSYYLHNRFGGKGWQIKKQGFGPVLYLDDEKNGLMALLAVGDSL